MVSAIASSQSPKDFSLESSKQSQELCGSVPNASGNMPLSGARK